MSRNTPARLEDNPTLARVVSYMRRFANEGKRDPVVISKCNEIASGLLSGDYAGEAAACYHWVHQNIRYARDPQGVEMVQTPSRTIEERAGDCDDMSTLLAAMCMRFGHVCRFALVGFEPNAPPSHVFVEVATPAGWVPLDPVAGKTTAEMMARIRTAKRVRV